MIEESVLPVRELDPWLHLQVLATMREVWPEIFADDEERYRERLWDHGEDQSVIRRHGDVLVSHAQVTWVDHLHGERVLRIGGLGNVITPAAYRGGGHGSAVSARATALITEAHPDLGLLFCEPARFAFYGRLGWAPLPERTVLIDDEPLTAMALPTGPASPRSCLGEEPLRLTWNW